MRRDDSATFDVRDERGSVTIVVAIMIPALLVVIGVVVIAAGWYEHKRHLQGQVDAAALAGAQLLVCGQGATQGVQDEVTKYISLNGRPAGLEAYSGFGSNVNQPTYPLSGKPDSDLPADTSCMVDVKATEQDVLPIFGKSFAGIVPFVSAHARVEAFTADQLAGTIPIGVEDSTPKNAWAQFIDENNNTPIGTPVSLSKVGGTTWSSAASSLNVSSTRVGVRMILSGSNSNTCGATYVTCYDLGSANGLDFIHGYDTTATSGTQPTPVIRGVTLSNVGGSCTDPYFTVVTGTCTLAVHASIDMGPSADPRKPGTQGGYAASVKLNGDNLVYDTDPASPTYHMWNSDPATGKGIITLHPGDSPASVSLDWEELDGKIGGATCKNGNNPCKGTFSNVQRAFVASGSRSGPIQALRVTENGTNLNSAELNSSHSVVVSIDLQSSLTTGVKRTLYFSASRPGGLDCGTASNYKGQLVAGCGAYALNPTGACPAFAANGTPECVPTSSGNATNQIPAGLNTRILNDASTCTVPNLYDQGRPYTGPRVVRVVLTPFGAFSGNANQVPISGFASFYITGWGGSGSGFINPCDGHGDEPPDGSDSGVFIVGHYIGGDLDPDGESSGTSRCDPTTVNTCVVVMTR